MYSDLLKVVIFINNLESFLGVHRNFSQCGGLRKWIFVFHSVTTFVMVTYTNIQFQYTVQIIIEQDSEFVIWITFFAFQILEFFIIEVSAIYYSKVYMNLLDKLRELRSLFVDINRLDNYQVYLMIASICYMMLVAVDIFTVNYKFTGIMSTFSWHFCVLSHMLHMLTCCTLNKKLTEIVICFNNVLEEVNDVRNIKLPEKLEKYFVIMNKGERHCENNNEIFILLYDEIMSCCCTINKIFGVQLCISIGKVFIYNFVTICGSLLENTGVILIQKIAYISIYILTVLSLIVLAHSGECFKISMHTLHCNLAHICNLWVKDGNSPNRLKYLLRLVKGQSPKLHACGVLDIGMSLVPAFFAFTTTYTIVFLQFQHVF